MTRHRILRSIFFALVFVVCLIAPRSSFAQTVDVTGNVDATEIELGDTVTYTLEAATSTRDAPQNAELTSPSGFTVVDSGSSPTSMVSIINGSRSEKHGLTAQWRLRSERLGTFTIGPASVALGGRRRNAPSYRVNVVAPGQGKAKPSRPRGRQPFDPFSGASPFDPFKGMFPGMDDDSAPGPLAGLATDPKLGLDSPRADGAFLHATVEKTRGVVGEQVTLNVYLYEDLRNRQQLRPTDVHEPTATDFVKRSLMQDETRAILVGTALVGGQPWSVKLVRKNALFPIKAGRLAISPMSLTLSGVRSGLRESEALFVDIVEPPIANRPPGYQIGDTGDFSLSATMTPREIDQHGAVGVTVELRGTGNMPSTLTTPEINGVEWLDPQVTDSLGPIAADKFGGVRTFTYVVRVHRAGSVDLGEVRLPYFDPQARRYEVAHTALGIVQVAKASGRDAGIDVAEPLLPNLPRARAALEGQRAESFLTERPLYWTTLFGMPIACVLGIGMTGALRRVRERRANAAPSPDRIARDRRSEAEASMKSDDAQAAIGAISRALGAEMLARAGVNVRGTSSEGATTELVDAGVSEETARAAMQILAECEDARFSPEGVTMETARPLWRRAKEVIGAIDATSRERSSAG